MGARSSEPATEPSWRESTRILGALELEGAGIIQPLHLRADAKWYAFLVDGDVLGPFSRPEDAKRAVEERRRDRR
jgi:hypothetical protein